MLVSAMKLQENPAVEIIIGIEMLILNCPVSKSNLKIIERIKYVKKRITYAIFSFFFIDNVKCHVRNNKTLAIIIGLYFMKYS